MTLENPHVQHGNFMEIPLRMVPFPRCHVRFPGGVTSQELIIPTSSSTDHVSDTDASCRPMNTQNDRTKYHGNISKPLGIPQQKPSLQSKNVCNLDAQIPHLIDFQQGPW